MISWFIDIEQEIVSVLENKGMHEGTDGGCSVPSECLHIAYLIVTLKHKLYPTLLLV